MAKVVWKVIVSNPVVTKGVLTLYSFSFPPFTLRDLGRIVCYICFEAEEAWRGMRTWEVIKRSAIHSPRLVRDAYISSYSLDIWERSYHALEVTGLLILRVIELCIHLHASFYFEMRNKGLIIQVR